MKVYQVGGAVRDRLMGLTARDRDWVAVGETPTTMTAAGFKQVGKDFPVFLHPDTGEEYALARTYRPGRGVVFEPDATIADDLAHRDLTMNALAMDESGALVDPFQGARDIADKIIRHVGDSFDHDPVRSLRVARFAARFPDFSVAPETMGRLKKLKADNVYAGLQPERVWRELVKALSAPEPSRFFMVLHDACILDVIFPEIDALFGVPQRKDYHPEIDAGIHTMMVLAQICKLSDDPAVRFAALVHDLGKALTPSDSLPYHHDHERLGGPVVDALINRLRGPVRYRELAQIVVQWHTHVHRVQELKPATIVKVLEAVDAFRRPERLDALLSACEADVRGRKGWEDKPYPQADFLRCAFKAARQATEGLTRFGPNPAETIRRLRLDAIKALP